MVPQEMQCLIFSAEVVAAADFPEAHAGKAAGLTGARRWLVDAAGSTELVGAAGSIDRGGAAVRLQAAPTPAWLATGRFRRPASTAPCCAPAEFGSACGPARRTAIGGWRPRRLQPPSQSRAVVREACRACRRGDAGVVSSASLQAAAVDGECGRSIEDPSAGFSRANRRRKADGTISRPSVKGVAGDACWRQQGHDGACWRHRLGFVVVNFRSMAALA
uniref:Uncharacterized protein n=1 Tax=Oryza sativa subsp. japonica TaxID=39947 RepID=Q8LME8_ORYSJ|nr:Hypothetical protein [Oryza sativa Japonica Group]